MTHITRASCDQFFLHRLIRIVPLYWLATAIYATLVVVVYPVIGKQSDNAVTLKTLLYDLFFIPRLDSEGTIIYPVLGVGWTLNLEMYFYLLFAGALEISRQAKLRPLSLPSLSSRSGFPGRIFIYRRQSNSGANCYVVYFCQNAATCQRLQLRRHFAATLSDHGRTMAAGHWRVLIWFRKRDRRLHMHRIDRPSGDPCAGALYCRAEALSARYRR